MREECTIKFISKENHSDLVNLLKEYDSILLFTPLYIHGMPGSVMKFIEKLDSSILEGKNLGFIIQAGFTESAQEQYVSNYFKQLAKELKSNYLGTVVKGEAALTYMGVEDNTELFRQLNKLGKKFEETNSFDQDIVHELGYPYHISDLPRFIRIKLKIAETLKLTNIGWNMMLKENNGYKKRFDKPFL